MLDFRRLSSVLEGESPGADVALADAGAGPLGLELVGGDGVGAGGVAVGRDGGGDGQDQVLAVAGDGEGLGRLLALALPGADLGQVAVGQARQGDLAVLGRGLHGAGREDTELVAGGGKEVSERDAREGAEARR